MKLIKAGKRLKIEFIPTADTHLLKPEPSVRHLPQWYKKMMPFVNGDKKPALTRDGNSNVTIKWCNPFGDALGAGYFLFLENDIQVTQVGGAPEFVWNRGGDSFISEHSKQQISPDLVPEGYCDQPYKFHNLWGIKTPPGYSVLFTHPLNRTEMPFLILSGVVDTDGYNQPVNFPFFIKEGFEGILEAGTPIAQVIPFKREGWECVISEFDSERVETTTAKFNRKLSRVYRSGYWKKKTWS